MELDTVFKIATFVLGAVGAAKILYELAIGRRSRMREEYKFAKDFLHAINENAKMHPFLKEKGYQAIAGDNHLVADEVEYLLSLKNPDRALRDYVLGRPYLEHLPDIGNLQLAFRQKYKKVWSRRWRKFIYSVLYAMLVFLAFSPLLLSRLLFAEPARMFVAFALSLVVFGPYAWFSLVAATRIYRAEKLVQHQSKHTQSIVLSSSNSSIDRTAPGTPGAASHFKR